MGSPASTAAGCECLRRHTWWTEQCEELGAQRPAWTMAHGQSPRVHISLVTASAAYGLDDLKANRRREESNSMLHTLKAAFKQVKEDRPLSPLQLVTWRRLGDEVEGGRGSGLRVQGTPRTPGKACGSQASVLRMVPHPGSNQPLTVFGSARDAPNNHNLLRIRRKKQVNGRNSPLKLLLSRIFLKPRGPCIPLSAAELVTTGCNNKQ